MVGGAGAARGIAEEGGVIFAEVPQFEKVRVTLIEESAMVPMRGRSLPFGTSSASFPPMD